MNFDLKSAVPITENNERVPEFDVNTALTVTEPVEGEFSYFAFKRAELHQKLKEGINQPLSGGEAQFIQDREKQDPGAFWSFAIPYAAGVVGFVTRPFGYRPTFDRPFGLERGPEKRAELEERAVMREEHPVAFTMGQLVAGVAPFLVTAPLFPHTLLGTLGVFETVGLAGELGRQRADVSLLMPTGERAKRYGQVAVKSGIMAPIWYFSGSLSFIGRPWLSALARASTRGVAVAGLETVFGADLEEALKQGGIITALSLMFEAPYLAHTALGRGMYARARTIMEQKGLKIVNTLPRTLDRLDQASARTNIFTMVKGLYNLMKVRITKAESRIVPDPVKRVTYDRLKPPPEPTVEPGKPVWTSPPPPTPMAGGMAYRPPRAPIFYSKLAGTLAEKMPESAPVDQVRGILKSADISKEEIEWSGVEEFLKGKEKVSKTELLNYMAENQLTIEESWKGGAQLHNIKAAMESASGRALIQAGWDIEVNPEDPSAIAFADPINKDFFTSDDIKNLADSPEVSPEEQAELFRIAGFAKTVEDIYHKKLKRPIGEPTKYATWTMAGGENYQELLLRIPTKVKTEMVERQIGGGRYNFADLEKIPQSITITPRVTLEGEGYKLPWDEFIKRIPHTTFNVLKAIEEFKHVTWDHGIVLPYQTTGGPRPGAWTQNVIVTGKDNEGKKYVYTRRPGNLTGPGATKVFVDGKAHSMYELMATYTFPDYEQPRPEGTTVLRKITKAVGAVFKAGHWEEPNVFAHIRTTDRVGPAGEKILFVEEFQSDWMLTGRREGFVGRYKKEDLKAEKDPEGYARDYKIFDKNGEHISTRTGDSPADAINNFLKARAGIPYHPAVQRWLEIALKRTLRYAAEKGYDIVSWTTGEQQAIRYDLSRQVNSIAYSKLANGKFVITVYDKNDIAQRIPEREYTAKELDDLVGKEIAQKITDRATGDWKQIKGLDLKIGGEWAKNLYDKQIVNWLNSYGKKFGAQVGTVDIQPPLVAKGQEPGIGRGEFPGTQPAIEITPQMKQALLEEGQPVLGKMPAEIGKPGVMPKKMQIFRMGETVQLVNTKGDIVTLPKGEEYRTLPVEDSEGNIVPNKVKLVDGKQVTVYEGELRKLRGELLGPGEEPIAGGLPAERPAPRKEERKTDMQLWATPDIMSKLLMSESDFVKKYITQGKSLEQIAKETGDPIEDVRKQEIWTYAHMQEVIEEQYADRAVEERAGLEEFLRLKTELRNYLESKLDPKLKKEEEYHHLAMLPWLWAVEGQGVRPDALASEIAGMGYPIEATEQDAIGLIEEYFREEIQGRARKIADEFDKGIDRKEQAEMQRVLKKVRATKAEKPERKISGVGNGSVISNKNDIDFVERTKTFQGMPFALLGNKAEALARLTKKFKTKVIQNVKKVFDLFGGAKGYRSGLFSDLPAENYNLNELSEERISYYRNVQDPKTQVAMKKELDKITADFVAIMQDAFGLPAAKSDLDFLEMLNSWLKLGLRRERYYFAKEIIQDFGNRLLMEAQADRFASPESSAKYFFLENTSLFGLAEGWTQGIIRTTKGDSHIRDILIKVRGLSEKLDAELKRDAEIVLSQEDAWQKMGKLTADIKAGKVNPKETVVLADPQYLNPSGNQGAYTVGRADMTWEGHKQNLDQYLLPLIETGVKIIYTNNADQQLINWLKAHRIPYNIQKSIGAMAERRGRDEIISFIGFDLGPEWTVGPVFPTGEAAVKPGELYVATRVTGQSAKFTEWLEKQELAREMEVAKQELLAKIEQIRQSKMLSKITVSRVKKYLGVRELKNTGIPEIQKVVDYLEGLRIGDRLLSPRQIETLQKMLGDIKDIQIMPKRIVIDLFGEKPELMEGLITTKVALEIFPTVDIKQGHPAVTKLIDGVNEKLDHAHGEIRRRDNQLDEMVRKAQTARAKKLPAKERIKRKLVKQDKEIFQALSGQRLDLTKEEVAVVAYVKNFFKMAKEKLVLKKFRKNYVTHLEQPFMEKIINVGLIGAIRQYYREQAMKEEIPTDIMLELDNIIGSEKFFRFALKRTGGITPTTNIQKIVHDYSSLYENKIALDQILPEGQVVTKLILQGKSAVWQKKFLQNLKGRAMDSEFRSGRMAWLARTADTIIDLGYIKLLALNWSSAMKNLVAGEANAMIWHDFSVYLRGKKRFVTAPKKAFRLAIAHGVLEGTYADYAQRGIGKLKKLQDIALVGQRAGEVEIRTCMFISELSEVEWSTEEISFERSRELKDNIAITQGIFSKTESPLWVQTVPGRAIMQMNRWRVTDAMLLRRLLNGAKEEWKQKNYNGPFSRKLIKALLFYAIGMYASYELKKAGYKKAARVAQSMAEVINSLISLISQGDLTRMISDNPSLSVIKEFFFTIQKLARYIKVPGAEKPRKIEFQEGIEETYISGIENIKDLIKALE